MVGSCGGIDIDDEGKGCDDGSGNGRNNEPPTDERICDRCGARVGRLALGGARCRCWETLDDSSIIALDAPVWRSTPAMLTCVGPDGIVRVVQGRPGAGPAYTHVVPC